MSSNKRICLRSDSMDRQSFDDRVCDDLCDIILLHLPLEAKLKLECVSKQFQRSILLSKLDYKTITQKKFTQRREKLEKLFKKFPYFSEINLGKGEHNTPEHLSDELIEMIIKNCNHLTHILIRNEVSIGMYAQRKLFKRFGQQLISLTIMNENIVFSKATNIEELSLNSIDSQLSQIEFKRLKKFSVLMLKPEDMDELDKFIEKNVKTLKHLDINSLSPDDSENDMKRLMTIIAKAKNLVHLGIIIWIGVLKKSFSKYWKEISINCKQLKSLILGQPDQSQFSLNDDFYSTLKQLKGLKRLELDFGTFNNQGNLLTDEEMVNFHPFKSLKGLHELTHFSIEFSFSKKPFSDTILIDIEVNFPKLQSLKVDCPIIASGWTAQALCKLKNLETIELKIRNSEIKSEIERQLIQNCKKLRSFRNNDFN